ncbi:MAG TPA: histidine phosphatase family protein [Paraburkholderia sp.]
MQTRLLLVSHALTAALRGGAFPDDEPLDARGAADTAAYAQRAPFPRDATVLTSPASCARDTAQALGLTPAVVPELAGTDHGHWRGRRLAELAAEAPDALDAWLTDPGAAPPGGESFTEVVARVGRWLDTLTLSGTVVAITHAPVIRAAIIHALRATPAAFAHIEIPPLSTVELRRSARGWAWWPAPVAAAASV